MSSEEEKSPSVVYCTADRKSSAARSGSGSGIFTGRFLGDGIAIIPAGRQDRKPGGWTDRICCRDRTCLWLFTRKMVWNCWYT